MRVLLSLMLLGAVALAGCARRKGALPPAAPASGRGATTKGGLIVTPETALRGRVAMVNAAGRFVVLTFPPGRTPVPEQRLDLYRHGLKVGEVKVTSWHRDNNAVADLVTGEGVVGDEARSP